MNEQLLQFKQQILQDPALQERFKAIANSQEFVNLAIQLGQELGYSFTVADVETALANSRAELSDEQLEAMAAGAGVGNSPWDPR